MMAIIFIKFTKSRVKDKNYATIRSQCFWNGHLLSFHPISKAQTSGAGDTATSEQNKPLRLQLSIQAPDTAREFSGDQGGGYKLTSVSPRRPNPIGTAWDTNKKSPSSCGGLLEQRSPAGGPRGPKGWRPLI